MGDAACPGRGENRREAGVTVIFCPPTIATAVFAIPGEPLRLRRVSQPEEIAGRSSAWLERQLWELDVAGSNPVAPIYIS
jgi:hypothetical protein